jgi:hypothetical protein
MKAPKVFIIHASEDKERFVLPFAEKLRSRGIDATLDRWEIRPGDDLVQKVFEELLPAAEAVIVVLSSHSVVKPWPKAELNNAVVRRIEEGKRLIAIVIEDCEIPESLRSLRHLRVKNLSHLEAEAQEVVATILGAAIKPPIGKPPQYASSLSPRIADLSNLDSQILKLAGERTIEEGHLHLIPAREIVDRAVALEISGILVHESLHVLDDRNYIEGVGVMGVEDFNYLKMTITGFEEYLSAYFPSYAAIQTAIALDIVNNDRRDSRSIQAAVEAPLVVIHHILRAFSSMGYVRITDAAGQIVFITYVSPQLKRKLS